jgi:hypothetical protein
MFHERLSVTLTVTIGGSAHTIPGANVKLVELDLLSYGFTGVVELLVTDDKAVGGGETDTLITDFIKPDLIEVELSVAASHSSPETSEAILPIAVKGIGTARSVEERTDAHVEGLKVLWRVYRIAFADPARVLWTQHFPCELYTEKSPKDVVEAHKGDKITLTYDWEPFAAAVPLFFLNLLPDEEASFYDFLFWYADTRAGVVTYDYTVRGYKIAGAKDASGTATSLFGDDIGRLRVTFPEVPRHVRNVLNSYTEATASSPIANASAATGIRQDYLLRTPLAQNVDDRVTLETSRLFVRDFNVELTFRRWPTVTVGPGVLLKLQNANLIPGGSLPLDLDLRVVELRLRARILDDGPDAERNFASTGYSIDLDLKLEKKDEKHVHRPPYVAPTYPGYLEGKIVSAIGEDAELTHDFTTDDATSIDTYTVKIPLFADQTVAAPYEPHRFAGKFYMPLYKSARVLVALELDSATIDRVLDWRDGVRMTKDVQGEQIFFGKKIGAATMLNHSYDNDQPVFNIARQNDKDKGTIQIKEGILTIQVKEDS